MNHDDKENIQPLRHTQQRKKIPKERLHLQSRPLNHLPSLKSDRYDDVELGILGKVKSRTSGSDRRERRRSINGRDHDSIDEEHDNDQPSLLESVYPKKLILGTEGDFDFVLVLHPVNDATEVASIVDFDADNKPQQIREQAKCQQLNSQIFNNTHALNVDDNEGTKVHVLDVNTIPSRKMPRGLAKNFSYEHRFLDDFMQALENGMVVRRHIPGRKPFFMKLWSKNRGDSINYDYISPQNAKRFLMKQVEQFDDRHSNVEKRVSAWAPNCEEDGSTDSVSFEEKNRSGVREIFDNVTSKLICSGSLKPERLVEVLGAEKEDHLASKTMDDYRGKGSHTIGECLRELNKQYQRERNGADSQYNYAEIDNKYISLAPVEKRTLTLILPSQNNRQFASVTDAQDAWFDGQATANDYTYIDIECATTHEYFMLLRGFSYLLSEASFRDSPNRFEMGLSRLGLRDGFSLNKLLYGPAKDSKSNHYALETCRGHPRCITPEIRIWNRLKRCGLQIEATFDVNGAMMIKLRCPTDKLLDEAQELGLKLKTLEGIYRAFDKDSIESFQPTGAEEESFRGGTASSDAAKIFPSAIRQHLIYYIINKYVGDGGAGLGVNDRISRAISIKSPLHMRAQLNALYSVWQDFTLEQSWKIISQENDFDKQDQIPPGIKRRIYGVFYMPLDSIEQYYGEKVAFYFAWLQHSTLKLIFPSLLGILVTLTQVSTNSWQNNVILPFYSFTIMIWSFRMMITWRRKQNDLVYKWGSWNFKEGEHRRPQHYGFRDVLQVIRKVFIPAADGRRVIKEVETLHYVVKSLPPVQRWLKYIFSISMSLILSFGALCVMLILHKNRDLNLASYYSGSNKDIGAAHIIWDISIIGRTDSIVAVELSKENLWDFKFWWIAGFIPAMIGIMLPPLNECLLRVSRIMNDIEDHKTETHYRNALVGKVIAFRFVSYFGALYYYILIAVSGSLTSEGTDADMIKNGFLRIATSLVIFLFFQQICIHVMQILFPIFRSKLLKKWRELRIKWEYDKIDQRRQALHQLKESDSNSFEMDELQNCIKKMETLLDKSKSKLWEEMYLQEHDPFFDYVQSVIYFSYVVCFSAVFPLTPLLVLLNQLINMRLHAYKICKLRRRPLAQKTGGLAVWEQVLSFSTMLGVITNSVLLVFTNPLFSSVRSMYSSNVTVALFACAVICERIMISIRYFMTALSPDKSKWLMDELQAHELQARDKKK